MTIRADTKCGYEVRIRTCLDRRSEGYALVLGKDRGDPKDTCSSAERRSDRPARRSAPMSGWEKMTQLEDPYIQLLRQSLQAGIITEEAFKLKKQEFLSRNGAQLQFAFPLKDVLGRSMKDWRAARLVRLSGPFESRKDCLRSLATCDHGNNRAVWKSVESGSSDGNRLLRVCGGHKDCQVHLELKVNPYDDKWYAYVTAGIDHALDECVFRRQNAPLSIEQVSPCLHRCCRRL